MCSFTSFESELYGNEEEQYDRKREELLSASKDLFAQWDFDEQLNQKLVLKIEEVLILFIKFMDAPTLYREFLRSRQHGALFRRVLAQVSDIACNCPHPLLGFLANHALAKLCYNARCESEGRDIKSRLLADNLMTRLVHALSTYTLVQEADSYLMRGASLSRASTTTLHVNPHHVNALLYLKESHYPSSFLREELYTLHLVGILQVV